MTFQINAVIFVCCFQYSVEDLRDFCDQHFHIAVNDENALEMYKLAKRHRLTRAQARLRDDFKKYESNLMLSYGPFFVF